MPRESWGEEPGAVGDQEAEVPSAENLEGAANAEPAADDRVEDIDTARVGAFAEKPVRDLAREEGATEEEKAILDRLAERRGEKAMQEYSEEREKNPVEVLRSRLEDIAKILEAKGFTKDAEIVSQVKVRLEGYLEGMKEKRALYEEKVGRRATLDAMQDLPSTRVHHRLPVTWQIGKDGGFVNYPSRGNAGWFGNLEDFEKNREGYEKDLALGQVEILNYSLSDQGLTEFCRALGVLSEDEEAIDIPAVYERQHNQRQKEKGLSETQIDPNEYEGWFQTNVDGLGLAVRRNARAYSGLGEKNLSLTFEKKMMEKMLVEASESA